MKKFMVIVAIIAIGLCMAFNLKITKEYNNFYLTRIQNFVNQQSGLLQTIRNSDVSLEKDRVHIRQQIHLARLKLKENDFWLRYLEPVIYKKINGPLPVEWETEVFEKFEKPYKRTGAGLTLAELYLDQDLIVKDSLASLIQSSIEGSKAFEADSITENLNSYHHFFLANRLFLLNLSSIYTTGFECPDTSQVIPELHYMLTHVKEIYNSYNQSFPATSLSNQYLELYNKTIDFVNGQPSTYSEFNHFAFIKDYINVLFRMNQQFITSYSIISKSYNDYSLNNDCLSIFDKRLYNAQNIKGIYSPVMQKTVLDEIKQTGKLLFYDPILSGNNQRSCASCHKPEQYFTDTTVQTNLAFAKSGQLPRNTISLINVTYNHLIMVDGRHTSLQDQANEVMMSHSEMYSNEKQLLDKILSCKEYKESFKKFLKLTPEENKITISHITSAITLYYGQFSNYSAPFDEAMNQNISISNESITGFNLFMSKAQCATCHFVPQFNGVKPPFISSEFEVLGVPEKIDYLHLSEDSGRYQMNPASEMFHAFRTGSIRNATFTKPYMHNGVFNNLSEVLDFYDAGGGVGKKLDVNNQTLSTDSLKLSSTEKEKIIAFIGALNEKIIFDQPPQQLPLSSNKDLNSRKVGGDY